MKRTLRHVLAGAAVCAAAPSLAFAHTGASSAGGLVHGFAHPMTGLDHVLAMVLVGLFAYRLGGRALWLVPLAFVATMALGGALAVASVNMPFLEVGIALSVIVLGAVVACNVQAPVAVAMALVGFFAIFHGHAHGTEMPGTVAAISYGAGFMIATALLHGTGLGLGALLGQAGERYGPAAAGFAGGMASIAGIGILTGLI